MLLRITTTAVVVTVILLSAGSAFFRTWTAPERIEQRMETAHKVCDAKGGLWTVDERNAPICKRD